MAQQGSSRPLRPIAPRTTPGDLTPSNPESSEEGKAKRASSACAECKRRRTKVCSTCFLVSEFRHLLLSTRIHSLTSSSAAMIRPAAPAPNVHLKGVNVPSTSLPINAGRPQESAFRKSLYFTRTHLSLLRSKSKICSKNSMTANNNTQWFSWKKKGPLRLH